MTPKQLIFISEYLMSGNATAAYKLAYGVANDNVAAVNAHHLLRNPKIAQYLQQFKNNLMESTAITLESVLQRINELSTSAKADADKLKALDMLMKHLGGYITVRDIIDKMDENTANLVYNQLLEKLNSDTDEKD